MWQPVTFEEKLLKNYHNEHGGILYLKVEIDEGEDDSITLLGLLLEGKNKEAYLPEDYTASRLFERMRGKEIKIVESCHKASADKIGKIMVEAAIVQDKFSPSEVKKILICSEIGTSLADFCRERGINLVEYDDVDFDRLGKSQRQRDEKFIDIRKGPDEKRQRAFLKGWEDALKGDLYTGAYQYKTHANMGNLFGWIYGRTSAVFREETWERYIENTEGQWD